MQNLLVGTATTGQVRVEWVQARYGQVVPTNWSWVQFWQSMAPGQFMALGYQVATAQNIICAKAVQGDYEWLLLYEHDMLPEPDALLRLSEYMKRGDVPIVSGLYFTRSIPSEPLIYRGRGTLAYEDFDLGDMVWADGVPTGFLLVHMSIIREMWKDSPEYQVGPYVVREIFQTPARAWYDPESAEFNVQNGTSDLEWCSRIMKEDYFTRAGWPEYADKEYPFLVDTNLMLGHINNDLSGQIFPPGGVRHYWEKVRARRNAPIDKPPALGISVGDGIGTGDKFGS